MPAESRWFTRGVQLRASVRNPLQGAGGELRGQGQGRACCQSPEVQNWTFQGEAIPDMTPWGCGQAI